MWPFSKRTKVTPAVEFNNPARYFQMGGGWGDAINWQNRDEWPEGQMPLKPEVVGWKTPRPNKGDILTTEMGKGTGVFVFTDVEYCRDPNDMFFATLAWRGYLEDVSLPPKATGSEYI